MAILTLEALAASLTGKGRFIGVDPGVKTIGLALSDVERRIATPLETVSRTKFATDAARMLALADKFEIAAFVIGLPFNMDGSEGPRAQATRAFARNLGGLRPMPIVFWDERLSTAAVTRALIEQDVSRARRAANVDKMAAAYILQGALDRLRRLTPAQT